MTPTPPVAPILGLSERVCRRLHWFALGWTLVTIAALEVSGRMRWLDHRPGRDAFEIQARPVFIALFALGAVLAWHWEIIGGALAAFNAGGLLIWAVNQLEAVPAGVVLGAFVVPGVVWILLDLHDQRPRRAVLGIGLMVIAVGAGQLVGNQIYDDLYGATHPPSSAEVSDDSVVDWILVGGVSTDRATVTARLESTPDGPVSLLVSTEAGLGDPRSVRASADPHGVVRFEVDGLDPARRYHVGIETGARTPIEEATFTTFDDGPMSFTIAAGSCARVGSNGAVYDAIAALDPALFVAAGDFHYANIERNDVSAFREVFDYTLSRPGQSVLYRRTPIAYVWDDHDYGGNNADATSAARPAAMSTYRQYMPHYGLAGPDAPIYQAFTMGRVRVILTDVRSARSPAGQVDDADKTMLGDEQQRWFEEQLLAADGAYPLIIWVNPVPWVGEAALGLDDWRGYSTERAEIADFIADNDIDGLLMVSGDAHMVAIDDGTNTDYSASGEGGFPLLHAGALDRPGHVKGGPYSHGAIGGGGQFGVVDVTDDGTTVTVRLEGRTWNGVELMAYDYVLDAS